MFESEQTSGLVQLSFDGICNACHRSYKTAWTRDASATHLHTHVRQHGHALPQVPWQQARIQKAYLSLHKFALFLKDTHNFLKQCFLDSRCIILRILGPNHFWASGGSLFNIRNGLFGFF